MKHQENQHKLFNSIIQFNAAELQGGGGSGLGLWSKCQYVSESRQV
jgi:hypothetical protein